MFSELDELSGGREGVVIAEALAAAAGIAFAERGPGDMGMSYGYADAPDATPWDFENPRDLSLVS